MNQTETTLARIFDICDRVAETGETIRTEHEGRDDARAWLGFENDKALPRGEAELVSSAVFSDVGENTLKMTCAM